MALLLTLIGATLIFAVFRDVFHTLFPYAGKLTVSRVVTKTFWRGLHRLGVRRPGLLYAVGPVAFFTTIGSWFILPAVGWALVYWPHMPSAFAFGEGLDAAGRGGFVDALYFSFGTQATLGYRDIVPTNPWLMMSATLQALSGLGVLFLVPRDRPSTLSVPLARSSDNPCQRGGTARRGGDNTHGA